MFFCVFNTIFVSISIAAGIRISHAFGAGNMEAIHHDISTVFFLILFAVSAVLCVCIPASRPIMRLCAFPEELIPSASIYFSLSMLSLFFTSLNQVYYATERSCSEMKKRYSSIFLPDPVRINSLSGRLCRCSDSMLLITEFGFLFPRRVPEPPGSKHAEPRDSPPRCTPR